MVQLAYVNLEISKINQVGHYAIGILSKTNLLKKVLLIQWNPFKMMSVCSKSWIISRISMVP